MKIYQQPLLALLALFLPLAATRAADATTPTAAPLSPTDYYAKLEALGVKLTRGPVTAKLGSVAELKVPEKFAFVGDDGIKKFYELNQNTISGREAGVLLAPEGWSLFFDYNDSGYVKDDEKDKLDAGKIMESMTANQDEANAARKARGWDEMKVTGWATPPHYDEKTNNLKWAINLTTSRDNFKTTFINESIRLLGRGGVMEATLVTDPPTFKADEATAEQLLSANFGFVAGQKYSEWKSGDKIAAYGLGALVLGGAGVLAGKAGLFAKLGALLLAAKKVIVLAVVALGGLIKKYWKKITGRV